VKSLAVFLRLTPILTTHEDGRIAPGGTLFGHGHLQDKFVRFITRRMDARQTYRVAIGHASAEAKAIELMERLRLAQPNIRASFIMPVGSTLSVHGGPGTLVVGVQPV
jgi:uncharacterized protein